MRFFNFYKIQKFATDLVYLIIEFMTFFAGTEIEKSWIVLRNNWLEQEVLHFEYFTTTYSLNVHSIKCPKRYVKMRSTMSRDIVQKFGSCVSLEISWI